MPLGVIPMIYFGILRIFGKKKCKRAKTEIWAFRAPMLQRKEPMPRGSPTPQRWIPRIGEAQVPKRAPLGYAIT